MLAAGLCLALGSTIALNWGYFAQHGAASALPRLDARRPAWSLRLMLASRRWLLGFLVGIAGWGLYVGALGLAPLSIVQATSAGGIGVLALLVQLGPASGRLDRRDASAVSVAVLGLALLGVSLAAHPTAHGFPSSFAVAGWLLAAALAAGLVSGSGRLVAPPAAALGIAAGIFYATGDIATKAALEPHRLIFVPAIFVAHGLAFVCLQLGFQRGKALVTVGLATLLTNALPIAAGTVLFREALPAGPPGEIRLAAFVLVVLGGAMLARAPAPDAAPEVLPAAS